MLRLALLLAAATTLNGSVALALTSPGCGAPVTPVCVLPLDAELQSVSLTRADERVMPVGLFDNESPAAGLAPPARPADLLARHSRAAATPDAAPVDEERPLASFAPPARPAHLLRTRVPEL